MSSCKTCQSFNEGKCSDNWKYPMPPQEHCGNWKKAHKQTNGDKIREMMDEEIVDQVVKIAAWDRHCNRVGILAWLKQEATDA